MKKRKSRVTNIGNLTIEQFNKFYPVGTKVKYYPIYTKTDEFVITKTNSSACEMCGSKLVGLEIGRGGYCFDNIFVLSEGEK